MTSDWDLLDRFVSFEVKRPAEHGRENFAGDPLVAQYVTWVSDVIPHDVRVYVSWQCPPDVSVLRTTSGGALLRSERLDTLLVEYCHLRKLLDIFDDDLAQEVASRQVLRWMCELLIGYRNSSLAVDALRLRPEMPGLEVSIWNPFRDETLASMPLADRTALQCFCLGHEIAHLGEVKSKDASVLTVIDGLPLMSHLDYELRKFLNPTELQVMQDYLTKNIDAGQLVSEVYADLFGFDSVAKFLHRGMDCEPEEAIHLALMAVEALAFVYSCKEDCRLLSELAAGKIDNDTFITKTHLPAFEWYARAKAVLRRAGFLLAEFEGRRPGDLDRNVDRMDEYAMQSMRSRNNMIAALENCSKMLRSKALAYQQAPLDENNRTSWALDPDLRLELFYILIAFGCPGGVNVEDYLTSVSEEVHRVPASEVSDVD